MGSSVSLKHARRADDENLCVCLFISSLLSSSGFSRLALSFSKSNLFCLFFFFAAELEEKSIRTR